MKKKLFESVCKKMLPKLPGFCCNGWLLYVQPTNQILRGFCCDDSGFDPTIFAVWVFYLPLYVPTKYVHFGMGKRLADEKGRDKWWNINDHNVGSELLQVIQAQGIPYLSGVEEPLGLATATKLYHPESKNPYIMEAIAYSLVMGGDYVSGRRALDMLLTVLNPTVVWQYEMMKRAEELRNRLNRNSEDARSLLTEWERQSRTNLGLEKTTCK